MTPIAETKPNALLQTFNNILPVFSALAAVLAVRIFLLFAVVGAFILAQAALDNGQTHSLYVLIAYCAFTILPLVWLDLQGRRKPNA